MTRMIMLPKFRLHSHQMAAAAVHVNPAPTLEHPAGVTAVLRRCAHPGCLLSYGEVDDGLWELEQYTAPLDTARRISAARAAANQVAHLVARIGPPRPAFPDRG